MIDVIECTFLIQKLPQKAFKITLFAPPKRSVFGPKTVRFRSQRGVQNVKVYFPKMCSPLKPGAIFRNPLGPFEATLGLFRSHFGVTLHILKSIWAYEGDFGALWNRIATTLKLLCVCERPLLKYFYATLRFPSSHFGTIYNLT